MKLPFWLIVVVAVVISVSGEIVVGFSAWRSYTIFWGGFLIGRALA